MPKGSFGSSRSSSSRSYSYSSPKSPVPTPSYPTSSPSLTSQHIVKVEQPGFFSNVLQGFGLGAGQSMAFNLFRSSPSATATGVTGATGVTTATQDIPFSKEYIQCMKEYNNNSDTCKQYLDKSEIKNLDSTK